MSTVDLHQPTAASIDIHGWRHTLARFVSRLGALRVHRLPRGREEDIGDLIAANGGVLTDDLERRINRRMLG